MIAYLRGLVRDKGLNYVVVENNGIGYLVFCSANFLNDLTLGREAEFYISHQIKEEASDLYGFKSGADLELFKLLLSVSGIGPKSALGILNLATAEDVKEAIVRGDAVLLTKVSGIGKKTAERLVLELKNKVVRSSGSNLANSANSLLGSDELDALMSLGYSLGEARTALNLVDPNLKDSGERVKAALRQMRKK